MEFSSSYISVLDAVVADRGQLLAFFTFGVMGVAFVLFLLMALVKKLGAPLFIINAFLILAITLLVCLFMGLLFQTTLFFSGVSGLKMTLIWIAMFLLCLSFFTYNFSVINRKIEKGMEKPKK
jgi:hypothetical protein